MDDLIGGMFVLMFVAAVVALLIAIALAMVAASAAIGSLYVGLRGTHAFLWTLGHRLRTRGGADRRPLDPEPAFELYVLGQLRRDLASSARDAWAAMQVARGLAHQFAGSLHEDWMMPLSLGAILGAYVGTVLGVAVSVLLTLPVVIVAAAIMAGSWALIALLRAAEALRRRVRRTSYECPVDHERFPLPVYVCPSCGAEHRQLFPGRWGIVKRECRCGKVALPTMVLNGRQRVPQRCPSGHPMAGIIGFAEIVRVALVAGPSAGKSTFLAGALHELDQQAQGGKLALNVVDDSRSDFESALANLARGRLPSKTQVGSKAALVAEVQGGGRSRVLSLYDVAGESYVGDDMVRGLRFLEVPSGLVMLVDPLSLQRFATDHEEEIAAAKDWLRPSPVKPIRVLESTVGALAEAGARPERIPVAVVLAKTDALGIGAEIERLERNAGERAVPAWLEQHGAGNFVRAVESSFRDVGWFAASALGRVPEPGDTSAFVPRGTAAPVLWLLRQNGIVPASTAFSPAHQAARLTGATAADFPPISRAGWAWRAVPATVASLVMLTAIGFGIAALVGSSVSGDDTFASASSDDEAGGSDGGRSRDMKTYDRGEFTIDLPATWRVGGRDVARAGYVSNRWYPSFTTATRVKVDYTRGFGGSAASGARSVRRLVQDAGSYRELSWRPARVDGRPAWRWEFELANRHKVDYFVTDDCGTGFAILFETTPGNWDRYRPMFQDVVRSVTLAC